MVRNSPATTKMCKLLMKQSELIKQFDRDMQNIISEMMFELGAAPYEEECHEPLAAEAIQKAMNKNVKSIQNFIRPVIVINVSSQNDSLISR